MPNFYFGTPHAKYAMSAVVDLSCGVLKQVQHDGRRAFVTINNLSTHSAKPQPDRASRPFLQDNSPNLGRYRYKLLEP